MGNGDGRWGTAWARVSFEADQLAFEIEPSVSVSGEALAGPPTVAALQVTPARRCPRSSPWISTIQIPSIRARRSAISYQLPSDRDVKLSIWNLAGQRVRELVHGPQAAGYYMVTWNGSDGAGRLVANGVYLYGLRAGDFRFLRKMLLVK